MFILNHINILILFVTFRKHDCFTTYVHIVDIIWLVYFIHIYIINERVKVT